jgi:hypothetical protein
MDTVERANEETAQATLNRGLQVGDLVKIAPNTLAWSAETILRKHVGRVISTHIDDRGNPRITVEFWRGRILSGREPKSFVLVERPEI